MFDIDRFKSINDGQGHLIADEILLLVSQFMKRAFRGADPLFRFGGEEFLVVLDQASDAGALVAIERLRTAIEGHRFPQAGRVTISAGYTRILAGATKMPVARTKDRGGYATVRPHGCDH